MTALMTEETTDGIADPERRARAVASVLAGMVLVVLDASVANIGLPAIAASLQASPASAVRIVTAYQLGLVMALLPAAALGESLGFRRVFFAGAALFTIASLACALSPSLTWLVTARFVQGIGGAGIMALGVALLRFVVPSHRLGAAIGWNAMTIALASAAGPSLGALVLSFGSWHWLFVVSLPVGISVLLSARALPDVEGTGRPLDLLGVGASAFMFALFVVGAESVPSRPLLAAALIAIALLFGKVLVRRESRHDKPLIPLDLLRQQSFCVSVLASVLCFVGQTAALVALPFHLQRDIGLSPLMTAFYLLPWPLAVAAMGPLAGKLADRFETARLCLAGGLVLGAGLAAATWATLHAEPFAIALGVTFCGVGFSLFNVPNNRNMFLSASPMRSGAAGGLQGVARLSGQTLGAVTMAVLFAFYPMTSAPSIGLAIAAALSLTAGAISMARVGGRTVR